MTGKIKSFFRNLLNKGQLIFAYPATKRSLWFGALLFFLIFGLIFPQKPVFAQTLDCGLADLACRIGEFVLSVMIKIVGLIFFGIPLLISTLFILIMALILGWIISPDFISLKFTQNPFVDIGLSITRNFANMGFIIFLVAIALATALRIEEYKAKKTLPTLILIALLINFSPVFVGVIIDASNIVMNFFLTNITGLDGFTSILKSTSDSLWQLIIGSGTNLWANIAAFMQVAILTFFNFFAGFIFILFSGLFIMRYIMLWILVILSPIAFVSYILPVTRRGGSLLSWRTWWEQLVAWSIIGIIAGFFLYLGFTMISMTAADLGAFVCQPGDPDCGEGLGLMNNVLPYLIPLVLLWIAYRETKRTSAMFAKEIIETPGKIAKAAAQVAIIAATAGAGAGAAAGALGKAAAGAQRLEATLGKVPIVGKPLKYGVGKPISWATRGVEAVATPPLLKYAAEARRVPEKELGEIDRLSGVEAEKYVDAKTELLPEPIKSQRRSQYMARMADKETLEFSSEKFQDEAKDIREKLTIEENPYLQKETGTLRKSLGDVSEEELVHSKLVGITDKDKRKEKEEEIREEIKKTKDIMQKRIGDEGLNIELGLKLKYITKDEVDKDKAMAAAKAKAKITAEQMTKFLSDETATATFVKELKPEDIRKMIDPTGLANRIGFTLGNPRNLQKVQDNFGYKKLKDVIEGRGGLNDATNTPEKLDEYVKINPAMVQSILTSPAYKEMDIEARKHMLDPLDQPTFSVAAFQKRKRMLEILEKEPVLERYNESQLKMKRYEKRISELQNRGQPTVFWEGRRKKEEQKTDKLKKRVEKNTRLKTKWEEIERLKILSKKRP